jgi:hypothetical protein
MVVVVVGATAGGVAFTSGAATVSSVPIKAFAVSVHSGLKRAIFCFRHVVCPACFGQTNLTSFRHLLMAKPEDEMRSGMKKKYLIMLMMLAGGE